MNYANSNDVKIKVIELIKYVFDYLTNKSNTNDNWERFLITAFILIALLILFYICCRAITKVLESLAKFYVSYRSGNHKLLTSARDKKSIQRRQQFCAVLDADLAYIDKAENWNDQYFTDLEAEVEAEGGYYSSIFAKLFRKKNIGIRRVSSLVKAIDTSTERAVLLVGEPGSGKSVALRHLAKQLAGRGKTSRNPNTPIPLYLNLRELEVPSGASINADLIKEFVLDNIRRGDADTSSYVRENWVKNKDDGLWFFLFDSFDEIPGVLHAASESQSVKLYSTAIRQFLDGMGNCRSVLASREYKGPQSLPWQKFRLLQLDSERQRKLVSNSFLSEEQIDLVLRHLAVGQSKLGNNPLFLTLLCRYVKDEGTQPTNDHQLLERHIERLAIREPEYILRKYNISSAELISGAKMLAVIFAENSELSLAPKLDEIFSALPPDLKMSITDLENLLSALVDVKIGRNDVATAKQGDRRFAFSHRRYQETLFASYLSKNPNHISAVQLLQNKEWREYTVAILQSQDFQTIQPLLETSRLILEEISHHQKMCLYGNEENIIYASFSWRSTLLMPILEILQEGMARRLLDVPDSLRQAIKYVLQPRWECGDHLDRYLVIKLGGLLPAELLSNYLEIALQFKIDDFEDIAFRQSVFLTTSSAELESKIRSKLAVEALIADTTVKRIRLQAIAAQLPPSLGGSHIVRRCQKIRPVYAFLNTLGCVVSMPNFAIKIIYSLFNFKKDQLPKQISYIAPKIRYQGDWQWASAFILGPGIFLALLIKHLEEKSISEKEISIIRHVTEFAGNDAITYVFIYFIIFFILSAVFSRRANHKPLSLSSFIMRNDIYKLGKLCASFLLTLTVTSLIFGFSWILGKGVCEILNYFGGQYDSEIDNLKAGLLLLFIIFIIIGIAAVLSVKDQEKKYIKTLRDLRKQYTKDIEVFGTAKNLDQVNIWLMNDPRFMFSDGGEVRHLSSMAVALTKGMPISVFLPKASEDTLRGKSNVDRFNRLAWIRLWSKDHSVRRMLKSGW